MARNIRDKLRLAIQDSYDLRTEDVLSKLERLFIEELELMQVEREFNYQDLCYIQSVAVQEFNNLRHDKESLGRLFSDPEQVRNLCVVNATVGFLRQKGFLPTILKYTKK